MLTRLEVDGFKNLSEVDVEFGPLTCIAGPNASGKSNLLDAISLLSLLADFPLDEAAARLRGSASAWGDPAELFWTDGERRARRIRLAAEMIVPARVRRRGPPRRAGHHLPPVCGELGLAPQAGGGHRLVLWRASATCGCRTRRRTSASPIAPAPSAAPRSPVGAPGRPSSRRGPHPGRRRRAYVRVHQDGGTGAEPAPTRADGAPAPSSAPRRPRPCPPCWRPVGSCRRGAGTASTRPPSGAPTRWPPGQSWPPPGRAWPQSPATAPRRRRGDRRRRLRPPLPPGGARWRPRRG